MGVVVQSVSLALATLGLISLSALLLTVVLADEVRRHPVFLNFLSAWVVGSVFVAFDSLAQMALPGFYHADTNLVMHDALRDMFWVVTQVATLNLVIHLWFTMKTFSRERCSIQTHKRRTLVLLVTPYLTGLFPCAELFYPPGTVFGLPTRLSMKPILLTLTSATLLFDVALLLVFWKNRQTSQCSELHAIMSLTLLMRLLVFCLFRLIFMIFCVLYLTNAVGDVPGILIHISECISPLLVFLLMGMKRDTLRVWFRQSGETHHIHSETGATSQENSPANNATGDAAALTSNLTLLQQDVSSGGLEFVLPITSSHRTDV